MKVSDNGLQLIKKYEGLRLTAYKCPAGVLTIGYGHTRNVTQNQTITKEEAESLLIKDLKPVEAVINNMRVKLSQAKFDALASFAYNIGISAFLSSTIYYTIVKDYSDESVTRLLIRWVYSKGRILPGLLRRRAEEANMYIGKDIYAVKGNKIVYR